MAIEILTVSLSDESIDRIVTALTDRMRGGQATTESNPPSPQNPQGAEPPSFQPQADPWANPAASQGRPIALEVPQQAPAGQGAYNPAAFQQQAPPQQQQNGAAPTCAHGPMRYVPAGFSQNNNRAYNAFWGCPQPRGAQDKCKSVSA